MHDHENLLYEDNEEDQENAYTSDHDCDLDENANDNDDNLSPKLYGIKFHYVNAFYCFGHWD